MGATINFGLPLIDEGTRDPIQLLAQTLEGVDVILLKNQTPAGGTSQWGDIAGGKYLAIDSAGGVRVVGDFDFGQNQAKALVVESGAAFPSAPVAAQLFYRSDLATLYVYIASWVAMGAITAGAVDTAGAVMEADFGATQGAILVRGASAVEQLNPTADGEIAQMVSGALAYVAFNATRDAGMTAGSLRVGNGTDATEVLVHPVSTPDRRILSIDTSVSPAVLKWRTPLEAVGGAINAKGDIIAGLGANSATRIPKPADKRVLESDSVQASGWTSRAIGVAIGDLIEVVDVGGGVPGLPALDAKLLTNVGGDAGDTAITVTTVNTATPYTPVVGDEVILADATSTDVEVTLPAASVAKRKLTIKRVNSDVSVNTATLTPNGSDKIDNLSTMTLLAGESAVLVADGVAEWHSV